MMYWIREIAGWGLLLLSLYLLRIALQFAMNIEKPQIVEASVMVFLTLGVMRAGIALIRVSTAARICRLERPSELKSSES